MSKSNRVNRFLVTATQMRAIEQSVFAAGMPVAALMEKVGGLLFGKIHARFPQAKFPSVGLLVGPGHNGGDALVVGRELWLAGYRVKVWMPGERAKSLTDNHGRYLRSLGVDWVDTVSELHDCQLLLDGLFGFGLERPLTGIWAETARWANGSGLPIVSIDVPSGIHTDSGEVLGVAIRSSTTYCLGLWKQGLFQDRALPFVGDPQLIDFGLPLTAISSVLGSPPVQECITADWVRANRPPLRWGTVLHPPNPNTHKYSHGHLLLVCGSARYSGAALLTALGARPTGIGMLTVAVPESIQMLVRQWVPEALVLPCPETVTGSIAAIPDLGGRANSIERESIRLDWKKGRYSAIAMGPGLDRDIEGLLAEVCQLDIPLVLDADGLNALARTSLELVKQRVAPTILTPHVGEFRRLFPTIDPEHRFSAVRAAAREYQATVLLKGACTVISNGDRLWLNPRSTSALARGGSGDVLTGLIGGFLAQALAPELAAGIATWWHAQAALSLAKTSGFGAVDPVSLVQQCQKFSPLNVTV